MLQLGNGLKQIRYQTVIRYLKDRCLFILVNRNNNLGILHTRQMLNGPGNTHGNIQLWCDNLARLPDLHIIGDKTGVNRRT
ncbi:hypothetical protein D3C77_706330 [compost metagenome]